MFLCELDLEPQPLEVRRARTEVAAQLTAWGIEQLSETAELLTSELVSNAIGHTDAPARLRLIQAGHGGAITIEVTDTLAAGPEPHCCDTEVEHGRGLTLIDAFAADWGWRPEEGGGKTVWARLNMSPAPKSAGTT